VRNRARTIFSLFFKNIFKNMECYVYALSSQGRNYIYVGISLDFTRRLHDHNSGLNRTTKAYCPFDLILKETYSNRIEAREREKFLKGAGGKRYLRQRRLEFIGGCTGLPDCQ